MWPRPVGSSNGWWPTVGDVWAWAPPEPSTSGHCCAHRTGVTPAGTPITWHTTACPGLETVLLRALRQPEDADPGSLADRINTLCVSFLTREPQLGSASYCQGVADTWGNAAAEVQSELGDPGGHHG